MKRAEAKAGIASLDRQRFNRLKEEVKQKSVSLMAAEEGDIYTQILQVISKENREEPISLRKRSLLGKRIFDALCRLDVLQPLAEDEEVTDIMVNGPEDIFYEKHGQMYRYTETFESKQRLEDLIQQIVSGVNRVVNESSPIVDARLKDGSRVNVVLPPISLSGPVLTIRKFRKDPITMEDLIRFGTLDEAMADYLERAVGGRKNIFVCGSTASGKTTLLNSLSQYIDPKERVVTIEDSAELRLSGLDNVVTLETRNANVEGKGAVTMRDLIKTSLRMNPDRIIVGEVRGAEALDMLSGLNTGHAGMSTGHANSCEDMLRRIETMVWMGADIPLEAIRKEIASAIDLLVFVAKDKSGGRKVREIVKVEGIKDSDVNLKTVCRYRKGEIVWDEIEKNRVFD